MSALRLLVDVVVVLLCLLTQLRWLRVAQREHYEAGRLFAMAGIWMRAVPWAGIPLASAALSGIVSVVHPAFWIGVLAGLAWLNFPQGMPVVVRGKPLAWTDRVKRLAVVTGVLLVVTGVLLSLVGAVGLLPLLALPLAELGLLIMAPIETRMGKKWQVSAARRIRQVSPRVVAITGSYGKTSTKNYAAHLLSGRWSVLASPASFNNAMGLSRAVNDRLVPGTDVFVAEMGTYGPGEIAKLCETFEPEVAAITTIGEAHLERMKNRETIVRAKSEILVPARTVVLNVDVPELAQAADRLESSKRVIRCSAAGATGADVLLATAADGWTLTVSGRAHGVLLPEAVGHPINVAIAVGLALALDVTEDEILARLGGIPATPHRAETTRTADGLTVIDDTYNANPDGAAQALASARSLVGAGGTVWTITPGMVELGSEQATRNAELARAATAEPHLRLAIVGRTNRKALLHGTPGQVEVYGNRVAAQQHVLAAARPGDVVLYENDLPDHYP